MPLLRPPFVLAALAALSLCACGDDDDGGGARRAAERPASPQPADLPPPLYDAHGALVPSGEVVSGVPLPRGLELVSERGRSHVYRTEVPLQKVQAYFGQRLNTPHVERVGEGAVFENAVVQSPTGQELRVTVSILPMVGGVRVEVRQLPLAPVQPMTESDYLEALRRDSKRWD